MEFLPADGEKAREILETIRSLGWGSFLKSLRYYVREIVLEFYANLNKPDRTSKVKGPGINSFPYAGTSWCQIPQLSISMPPPPLDNEAFFSDVTTISGIATSSIPIHFFNEGPSVTTPNMEKNNFDMDLDFFHYDGTSSSGH
nr:uncharacterized protein LOC117279234 [Nicotiana tomentosiformis]